MNTHTSESAHALALRLAVIHWPKPCRVCGNPPPFGMFLTLETDRAGRARYKCTRCHTTISRRRRQVASKARRVL